MSFSKAKIQRFNDIKPCAPSPAAYGVTNKDNIVKNCVGSSSQSERIVEPRSPCISETGSVRSVPCRFRTPTLPKKKKTTTSATKSKPLFGKHFDLESLKEKIVECENKDAFIRNLTEEIEELKEKLGNIDLQKKQFDLEKEEMEINIINLKTDHENEIEKLTKQFEGDISIITEEKIKVSNEITLLKKQYDELKEASRKEMIELKNNCDKFNTLYSKSVEECNKLIKEKDVMLMNKEQELKALETNCIEIQKKRSVEIERLKKEHQIEIQDIEFEILKTMTELQKEKEQASSRIKEVEHIMEKTIFDLQERFKKEKQELLTQYDEKLKQITEEMKEIEENQKKQAVDEMETNWKNKLETQQQQSDAILKECQTISEYNIIQCELEKKEIEAKLMEKTRELESMTAQHTQLLSNYEDLKIKYDELQNNFSNTTKQMKTYREENRAYLITIKNSQNTIEVLKDRLINSDRDVEQLKKEVADTEANLLQYENKCIQLTSDLKQAQDYNEELEMQHESAIKINTDEIQQLKTDLLSRVEEYGKQVEMLSKKLKESEEVKQEIMQQLHEAHEMIEKSKMEFDCFETIHSQYEFEVEQSHNELEDYRMREMEWNNLKERLEHNINELENILETKQDEVNDFKKQLTQLQDKCESYYHHSEYYKNKVAEYEKELDETGNIHKKYIEQSGKYDQLLQKFEQLERENSENKKKVQKLSRDHQEKENCLEMYNQQKEAYNTLSGKYEQLEKENSRNKKKADGDGMHKERLDQTEQERDALLERVIYLEEELKEVSDKYAHLAGHSNNKQKIKHLVDLKTKNEELHQANIELESKVKLQLKAMEKLKKENNDLKKCMKKSKLYVDEKENISSPNRSLNSSRVESPFRERN